MEVIGKSLFYAFGLAIESDWDIPCLKVPHSSFASIHIRHGAETFFSANVPGDLRQLDPKRIHFHQLTDGSRYLRWRDSFEFHLSPDAKVITARSLDGAPEAAFKTYMLGHLVSYVLLGMGIETIHAAGVVIDGNAVGLLGDSARGKSTLAAAFIQHGERLLSDDFLVVRPARDGDLVYPGLPRIKLYERVAKHLVAEGKEGTPMNSHFPTKMIYPTDVLLDPAPLRAFYSLASPKSVVALGPKEVRIQQLTEREAYLELTENSFTTSVQTPQRLASQFQWATELVKRVPVKRLSYPRVLSVLPEVVAAVKEDLATYADASRNTLASTLPTRTP